MGYKPTRKVYKLVFADEEMDGLVVRCHSVPIGEMMSIVGLVRLREVKPADMTAEDLAMVNRPFELFADALVSWNVEDETGVPVPATLAGVMTQDADFLNAVIKAWMENVAGIPGPLARSSTGGTPSLEESIPMESL
jgi:hypothetical protein